MSKAGTRTEKMEEWERLIQQMTANAEELAYLEPLRVQLEEILAGAREESARHAVHTAAKQEASARLKTLRVEGERLATLLKGGVKQQYGIRSEKLSEFGVKPFRGRNRKKTATQPELAPAPEMRTPASGNAGSSEPAG